MEQTFIQVSCAVPWRELPRADSGYDVVQATKAMIMLLETEKLTPGHTEGALRIEREQRTLE